MTPHSPVWKQETTHRSAWLGPWRVFNPRYRMRVTRQYTPAALADVNALQPLTQALPDGQDGWLLYAHPTAQRLPVLSRLNGWLVYVPQQYEKYVVDLTLGVEAYWAQFSSKTRFNLKRNVKLLTQASGDALDWRTYRTPEELAQFHALALPLSQKTYQHKLFQGGLPSDAAFMARMATAAQQDDVRAYLLFMEGQPLAYAYMVQDQGFLDWAYMGHDATHANAANLSPGTVLLTLGIEALQQEGRFRWLDFGSGEGQHKSVFSTQTLPVADVLVLPPTLRNRLVVGLHRALTRAFDGLRRVSQRLGLHAQLKRWVRQRASG